MFAGAVQSLSQSSMSGGIFGILGQRIAEFFLRFGKPSRSQCLPPAPQPRAERICGRRGFRAAGNRNARRVHRVQRGQFKLRLNPLKFRQRLLFGIQANDRQILGRQDPSQIRALGVRFNFFSSLFQCVEKQGFVFGIIGCAIRGFMKMFCGAMEIISLERQQPEVERIIILVGFEFRSAR